MFIYGLCVFIMLPVIIAIVGIRYLYIGNKNAHSLWSVVGVLSLSISVVWLIISIIMTVVIPINVYILQDQIIYYRQQNVKMIHKEAEYIKYKILNKTILDLFIPNAVDDIRGGQ